MLVAVRRGVQCSVPRGDKVPTDPYTVPVMGKFDVTPTGPGPTTAGAVRAPMVRSCPVRVTVKADAERGTVISSLVPGATPGVLGDDVVSIDGGFSAPVLHEGQLFSVLQTQPEGLAIPVSGTLLSLAVRGTPPVVEVGAVVSTLSAGPLWGTRGAYRIYKAYSATS